MDRGCRFQDCLHRAGSPWENGYIESFNARLRDELLNGEIFYTLREAQIVIESWRRHYNTIRPHASLGYKPPAPEVFVPAFAAWPAALRRPASPATLAQPPTLNGPLPVAVDALWPRPQKLEPGQVARRANSIPIERREVANCVSRPLTCLRNRSRLPQWPLTRSLGNASTSVIADSVSGPSRRDAPVATASITPSRKSSE